MISFRKAGPDDGNTLLAWLDEPHVREFWDLSDEGRANMLNYLQGTSNVFDYWVGDIDGAPFCQVMTTDARDGEPRHLTPFISPHGETWTMDFMIGEPIHVGRGLAAPTLAAFAKFAELEEPRLASLLGEASQHVYPCALESTSGTSQCSSEIGPPSQFF